MGFLMIPLALLAGWLLGYPTEVIFAGTIMAFCAMLIVDTARKFLDTLE